MKDRYIWCLKFSRYEHLRYNNSEPFNVYVLSNHACGAKNVRDEFFKNSKNESLAASLLISVDYLGRVQEDFTNDNN